MNLRPEALVTMGVGLLLVALNIPLIRRKVPMNKTYGFRLAEAFKSEKNWYDINAAGGRIFMLWTLPIFAAGLIQLFLSRKSGIAYFVLMGIVLICPMAACFHSSIIARRIDRQNGDRSP